MTIKQHYSDWSTALTSTSYNHRGVWVTLGGVAAAMINCIAAVGMTGFSMFGFSQLNDEKRADHFTHDAFCIVSSAVGAAALLMIAGAIVLWILDLSHRRIIIAGTVIAGLACLCHGFLFRNSPLTGSQDFRAMEGLGNALLSMIDIALSMTTTIINLIFLLCTTKTRERQSRRIL